MKNIELLEGEIWKEIPECTNYLISNYARVYTKKFKKLLKNHKDCAALYINDKRVNIPILKLMRELFPEDLDLSEYAKIKSLPDELWIPVKNYEDYYHISNMGRLKILDRICFLNEKEQKFTRVKREHISKGCDIDTWYPSHILVKNKSKKTVNIHRLVAEHFILNPLNLPQVNHKNGLKYDNKVENLEWCTAQENTIHAYVTGLTIPLKGSKRYNAKINEEKAKEIKDFLKKRINFKPTLGKTAEIFGVSRSIVREIWEEKSWKHIN